MEHLLLHSLQLFGFGLGGVLIMAFIKMNDINQTNDTYTFKYVRNKFINREWPSYGLALTIVLIAALSHEEWIVIFQSKVQEKYGITIGVNLFMVCFGCLGQYFIYKRLGKMAKTPPPDQNI